ncbi:hypothetical protein BH11BAC6_BH11BAC6_04800 [soil metagenome]
MPEKIAEIKNLIEINDELENYFRNTIIPQLYIDGDLILQKFTPPAMKQFTLSKSDVGRPIVDIKENFRFPTIIDNIQEVMQTNEILEKEIQTTDMRWYQMNIIPYITIKEKKTNGVIITFVEITLRITDLKDQQNLISDYETLLDTIAHDIKTPLTSLSLLIEVLKLVPCEDKEQFQLIFKNLESSTKKMQHLIVELTESGRQHHKYKAEEELLDFEHILEDVRLTLSDSICETGAVIKKEIKVPQIHFSKRKLRSIIYNLVNNAIKYRSHDRKPEIFIKTEMKGDFIVLFVKDNAEGIDESRKEAIFSKYYRGENAVEGSGIGLYLVKEIVQNAGGKILVESEPGIGSEFKVYLKSVK